MSAPTLNEDPDACLWCRQAPAVTLGFCLGCLGDALLHRSRDN